MPKFQKNPDELTYGEVLERLKKNPDDLELQVYKETLESTRSIGKAAALTIQSRFSDLQPLFDYSSYANMLADTVKSVSAPVALLPDLSSVLAGFKIPNFAAAFETPRITYLPPSGDLETRMALARIEARLDESTEQEDSGPVDENKADPRLVNLYPADNKKYRVPRKILLLLAQQPIVNAFLVAKCIDSKLTRKRFKQNKGILEKVENRIRVMREKIKPYGYFISFRSGNCELITKQ